LTLLQQCAASSFKVFCIDANATPEELAQWCAELVGCLLQSAAALCSAPS